MVLRSGKQQLNQATAGGGRDVTTNTWREVRAPHQQIRPHCATGGADQASGRALFSLTRRRPDQVARRERQTCGVFQI
jgi:hypothetical protein